MKTGTELTGNVEKAYAGKKPPFGNDYMSSEKPIPCSKRGKEGVTERMGQTNSCVIIKRGKKGEYKESSGKNNNGER